MLHWGSVSWEESRLDQNSERGEENSESVSGELTAKKGEKTSGEER